MSASSSSRACGIPELDDATYDAIARAAARLSCPDERFAEFAAATGVEVGPLHDDERDRLRAEIDAASRAHGASTPPISRSSSPTSPSTPSPRTTGSSSVATSRMPRPDVLDNLRRRHPRGGARLSSSRTFPRQHGLSIATGYVNLGGLHHLAAVVDDGRGAPAARRAPRAGARRRAVLLCRSSRRWHSFAGERDLSRFPPSRAAERLQAVEAWLDRARGRG